MAYDNETKRFQQEMSAYLKKVRAGRRVAKHSPDEPQFSEQAERDRILKSLGVKPTSERPGTTKKPGKKASDMSLPSIPGFPGLSDTATDAQGVLSKITNGLRAMAPKGKPSSEPASPDYDPFASADERHSVWSETPEPVLMAQVPIGVGGGNKQAMSQLNALDQEQSEAVSPDKAQKAQMHSLSAMDATQGVLQQSTGTPTAHSKAPIESADAQEQARQAKVRANMAIEQKLGLGIKPSLPNETADQRNRRLHPELY